MRISDWSSDVCSSDLTARMGSDEAAVCDPRLRVRGVDGLYVADASVMPKLVSGNTNAPSIMISERSEEHTSELQSLMRISYAVFCLKTKNRAILYHNSHSNSEKLLQHS